MTDTRFQEPLEKGWIAAMFRRVRLETPMREFVSKATNEQLEQINRLIESMLYAHTR